jgi:hypothetical protein
LTTLPPSCAVVMKSGNLNFLEPSGPRQACNGADCFTFLPLSFILIYIFLISILDFFYLLTFISVLYIYLFFSSLLPCFPCGWLVAVQSRPSRSVFCCRHARREVNDWVDQMHIPLIHLPWGFTYHTTYACTGKIQGSTIVR